jgi:hypothetical protein
MCCSQGHFEVRMSIFARVDAGITVRPFNRCPYVTLRNLSINFNEQKVSAACIPYTRNHVF